MATPRVMRNLEIHAAHACNLACESCSHYSNHGHKGIVSLDEAREWLAPWAPRLAPQVFSILGGEPTIHPDLTSLCELARGMFPKATLRVVTNGAFETMDGYQWVLTAAGHDERHVRQILELKEDPNYPAAA